MPNIFKSLIVRRFLSHALEIGVVFSISLVLIKALLLFSENTKILNLTILEGQVFLDPNLTNYQVSNNVVTNLYLTIIMFTVFYFIYTAFNFFFTFSYAYPKNDFSATYAQKLFGFKKFEFKNKKESHLKKSLRMLLRETLIAFSVYGVFALLTFFRIDVIYQFFVGLLVIDNTFLNLIVVVLNLAIIFVLPALMLNLYSLKITKGKQLFWDYLSGVTLK